MLLQAKGLARDPFDHVASSGAFDIFFGHYETKSWTAVGVQASEYKEAGMGHAQGRVLEYGAKVRCNKKPAGLGKEVPSGSGQVRLGANFRDFFLTVDQSRTP